MDRGRGEGVHSAVRVDHTDTVIHIHLYRHINRQTDRISYRIPLESVNGGIRPKLSPNRTR